jgi:AAA domain
MRYFNSSGPNISEEHYTLDRPGLIAKGLELVARRRYFTIWAPRQTGKSTYFLMLKKSLEKTGYKVVKINVEDSSGSSFATFQESLRIEFAAAGLQLPTLNSMGDLSNYIRTLAVDKLVLIVDEIEGLNPDLFGSFLHTIRNLYHSREEHGLKSVILVGVSNIVGVVSDNASPFNVANLVLRAQPRIKNSGVRGICTQWHPVPGSRARKRGDGEKGGDERVFNTV